MDVATSESKADERSPLAVSTGSAAVVTHDYTKRFWGHDYTFEPRDHGKRGSMMGWGHGIEKGNYLLLQNGDGSTRYRVESVKYMLDPRDMWSAEVTFAPRTKPPNHVI